MLVKPGDTVKNGQAVLSVETDKAGMEVESDIEGVVEQIQVKPGSKIGIGSPIMTLSGFSIAKSSSSAPVQIHKRNLLNGIPIPRAPPAIFRTEARVHI